ncbi:unnamed protein product [Gongylonema pulchrum]|uniref:Uncharacterized protein n=1 Tax=Gongylonema pulchrum TaxID=637853 RepID=A0A183D8K8_9BILA|nr:unnamed protein product [Gongylonema pulchrum]
MVKTISNSGDDDGDNCVDDGKKQGEATNGTTKALTRSEILRKKTEETRGCLPWIRLKLMISSNQRSFLLIFCLC